MQLLYNFSTTLFSLDKLLRENIKNAKPYSSARDEYKGKEGIFLDANENPYGSAAAGDFNRYPDPLQWEIKEILSNIKRVEPEKIFLGNGSDEPIDLIIRMVCRPGKDNIIILPPTYGMYEVSAAISDVEIRQVPLTEDYQLRPEEILKAVDENTKVIFICSPNNPTGNIMNKKDVEQILKGFNGIVVVDEAYIDFAPSSSLLSELDQFPNLIVLQTLSKAWGMAGLRLGMAFASKEIISVYNKIKYPYNINIATQQFVKEGLMNILNKEKMVAQILEQREKLGEELKKLPFVSKVYPSDANFLLVKMDKAPKIFEFLIGNKIITRDRSKVRLCEDSIRISVGTEKENEALMKKLSEWKGN